MSDGASGGGLRTVGVALGVAVLLGVAVAGGSILDGGGTNASAGEALPYALLGSVSAVLLAATVVWAIRSSSPEPSQISRRSMVAILLVAGAVGALLGSALTPRSPTPEEVSPLDDSEIDRRREAYDLDPDTVVRPLDLDGDGELDLDEQGRPLLAYDQDGDGVLDGFLQPCPEGSPPLRAFRSAAVRAPQLPPDGRQPLDIECDGEIDGYLELDPMPFTEPNGAVPPPAPPQTVPPAERQERADRAGPDGGGFGRVLLVALAVLAGAGLAAAAFVAWRRRDTDGDDADDDANAGTDTSDGVPTSEVDEPVRAAIAVIGQDVDPRRAICAAYGELLDQLARAGVPRRPEEAPLEHLARSMRRTSLDEANVRELIDLFSLARFSNHPVTEAHREAAANCLRNSMRPTVAAAWPPPGVGT